MKVYLVGIGMGNPATLTLAARDALSASGLVVGAPRMLDCVRDLLRLAPGAGVEPASAAAALAAPEAPAAPGVPGAPRLVAAVRADDVVAALEGARAEVASVVYSGDVGFFSGAALLAGRLVGWDVEEIPGVSSLSYLAAKARVPWQDAFVVSVHGREGDAAGAVQAHAKTFVLTGGATKAQDVCAELVRRGLGDVEVVAGERLSYADERVVRGTAAELASFSFADLTSLIVLNARPVSRVGSAPCLPDSAFVRGEAPMTKEEVRELVVCKLKLRSSSVVWDVGAGTGSVSVEAALAAPAGRVFAVERDGRACELVRRNKERFGLANLAVVHGEAPAALEGLPAPDCVFVGGSAGRLREVVAAALAANPRVRVVVTAVSLETVAEAAGCLSGLGMADVEAVQVSVSRARALGDHHLMLAQNPVFVFSANGAGEAGGAGEACGAAAGREA